MLKYLLGRIGTAVPTILAVLLITFTLTYVSPFDPVRLLVLNNEVANLSTEENIARIRSQYGLDRPFAVQFVDYIGKLARGDWGISIVGQRDIWGMISHTLPISAQLGLAAAILTTVIGVPLGVLAAQKHNSWLDYLIVSCTLILYTLPVYVLAPLLLILFVLVLDVMKVPRGWHGLFSWQSIIPVILLTFGPLAIIVRQTRQSVLEVLSQDYIRTAKAKGLSTTAIAWRHIMRNALIPVVTALGLVTEGLIASTVFIDTIFAIPGFGSIAATALTQLDYPVILGVTLISSILVIATNTLVDLVYPVLDPRVKLGE
jgi:ABC-type dipeptide/oligopeptide/nickel transport system permease component